jgi:hypothetical protein
MRHYPVLMCIRSGLVAQAYQLDRRGVAVPSFKSAQVRSRDHPVPSSCANRRLPINVVPTI